MLHVVFAIKRWVLCVYVADEFNLVQSLDSSLVSGSRKKRGILTYKSVVLLVGLVARPEHSR